MINNMRIVRVSLGENKRKEVGQGICSLMIASCIVVVVWGAVCVYPNYVIAW